MKHQKIILGIVLSTLTVSVEAGSKEDCKTALQSLGYNLSAYVFEEAGWVSKEKHIFDGTLVCFVNKDSEIHSIKDNGVLIAKDGFFGQDALAKRDVLNAERKKSIDEAKRQSDKKFKEIRLQINEEFDTRIQKVKLDSEPPGTPAAREARERKMIAARKTEEERIAKEEADAEDKKRKEKAARLAQKADAEEKKRKEEAARLAQKAEDKRKGFHCLSAWDGSHREVVKNVKRSLNDPDSFEHDQTLVSPVSKEGTHNLTMHFRAKNAFGGYVRGTARATYTNAGCTHVLTECC